MGYSLDLNAISLSAYLRLLKGQTLLPGRRMLHEQIEERFLLLASSGLENAMQLKSALSTPLKMTALAKSTGIPEEYLTLLRRELSSLEQKPVPLSDFPACDPALIRSLAESGIRNSKEYWGNREKSNQELFALCDLARINGVGAVAARAFYEAGFGSVAKIATANSADMLARISAVNAQKGFYKANLGEKDMQFCIDYAQLLVTYS